MRLSVALLGLLLALPLVAAQPSTNLCGPIETAVVPPARPLAVGETGTVTITVTNQGQVPMTASASLNIQSTAWTFDKEAPAAQVPAGETRSFAFDVSPTDAATGDVTANLLARATCQAPAGGLACPADQCSFESAQQATIRFQAAQGLEIPFLESLAFPPEYLIASLVLVGLVAAIVVLARRPKGGVAADCPEPLKMVRAGRGASFPIEVTNRGADAATARLEVGSVPEGWSAFMPLPDVQLAPRESRSLFLMVRAPENAAAGEGVEVELAVRDPARPEKPTYVRVRAEVADEHAPATA